MCGMDVRLLSKRGVPDDATISIRSGAVRRQGDVSGNNSFRFPQSVSETECVVKVDIMQTIGSGYIVMRPNQTEGRQYEVVMGDNMACELEVAPTNGLVAPPSTVDAADAAAKGTQDAKRYLETTGLLAFVQGVLLVVAKQRPDDPFAAMAKHFLSASDEAVRPTPGSPKVAPPRPKAAPEEARPEDHVDNHKSDALEGCTSTVPVAAETAGSVMWLSEAVRRSAPSAPQRAGPDMLLSEAVLRSAPSAPHRAGPEMMLSEAVLRSAPSAPHDAGPDMLLSEAVLRSAPSAPHHAGGDGAVAAARAAAQERTSQDKELHPGSSLPDCVEHEALVPLDCDPGESKMQEEKAAALAANQAPDAAAEGEEARMRMHAQRDLTENEVERDLAAEKAREEECETCTSETGTSE